MIESLIGHFAALDDPRCADRVEHRLVDVLVIAIRAVIADAATFEDIALYGRCEETWLRGFLEPPGGVPSHDTFRRVPMPIEPDAFERCFMAWARAAFRTGSQALEADGTNEPDRIAVDGKAVRHSFDRRRGFSPLHPVSAYATGRGLVLAQRATADKGGGVAALPAVLGGLTLEGCLVSLDAPSCRREVAGHILARGADYLLTLKGNRGRVHDEVRSWFATHAFDRGADLRPCLDAFDDTHGRLVRRRVFACPDTTCFTTLRDWPGIATVLATETIRGVNGAGVVTAEIRHYPGSSTASPETLARAIRRHRSIENGRHWVLDVTFGEDRSRVRDRCAARNLALLRRIALNMLRADTSLRASLKGKRKTAAWNDAFMERLLRG